MVKKGFMRTIEVLIAALITFVFLLYAIPSFVATAEDLGALGVVAVLLEDPLFTDGVVKKNITLIDDSIRSTEMLRGYNYTFTVHDGPYSVLPELPPQSVVTESYFFVGNGTVYVERTFRLYYWKP